MDNTVGSQKKINSKQKRLLIGTLLGDGTLELNGRYARLRINHSLKQKTYVEWKHKLLYKLAARDRIVCFSRNADLRTNKTYYFCRFDTNTNFLLDRFYKIFYVNGKKRVPNNIIKVLNDPLSLAVWFMDDGYKRNDCNSLRISTDAFTFKEQILLKNCLKENFNIDCKIHRKGKYWNIYIPSLEAKKFSRIIKPYIIPEMKYKILTP
ncbi:MAG: hypothetical protein PHI53_00875 [Candidatus Pacebacteria bacterium]|nr:hypothetical protein [Candidatus Paceibacterota bacterium]